jgi:transposase
MFGGMKVKLHAPTDLDRLRQLVRDQRGAKQRDRYRVVLIAAEGLNRVEATREQIATAVGRSRQFVDEWVGRYRTGGTEALCARKQPGGNCKLTVDEREQLKLLLDAGPQPGIDKHCVFGGRDVREIIHARFNKLYSPSGTYKLLHGMGYSWLCPRPHHPKGDPVAQDAFKKKSSKTSRKFRRLVRTNVS